MNPRPIGHASHLSPVYSCPRKYAELVSAVTKRVKVLKQHLRFEGLAFRGNSGAAVACPVALALGLPMMYVRKPSEKSHSSLKAEGPDRPLESVLVVDDLIASGDTMREIEAACLRFGVRMTGILLWWSRGPDQAWVCKDGSEVLRTTLRPTATEIL